MACRSPHRTAPRNARSRTHGGHLKPPWRSKQS
jgi:hypothetical protein